MKILFYTCVPYMTIISCIVPEIRQTKFFVILDHFLLFYPTNNPENQNFEKKAPGDIIIIKILPFPSLPPLMTKKNYRND